MLDSNNAWHLPEVIKRNHPTIKTYIKFDILIQFFNKYNIFTDDEMDCFNNSANSKMNKVNQLISYLHQKDNKGNCNFIRALSDTKTHSGHCVILKELYKAMYQSTAQSNINDTHIHG